ncbi:MAG: RNA-binding protein [Proteobacteria bacterium]|nr:RNA-binding protein [Pseudomonadota bacterium]
MSRKLFVGGLSWDTDERGLRTAFEQFGELEYVKVVLDRETGRSRGFGFVTFADDQAGQQALEQMDGAELDGRNLRVNEAHDRAERPRYSGGPDSGYQRGGPDRGKGRRRSGRTPR